MSEEPFINLRPFERQDLQNYRKWVNHPEIAQLIDRVLPVSTEEHERWYATLLENRNAAVFAIETVSDGCYIGNTWLYDIDWRHRKTEVRILIGEKGY